MVPASLGMADFGLGSASTVTGRARAVNITAATTVRMTGTTPRGARGCAWGALPRAPGARARGPPSVVPAFRELATLRRAGGEVALDDLALAPGEGEAAP